MDRKILVTGGAGFLGSHLCDRLIGRGDEVLCVDNFFTGTKRNIEHLLPNPRFELMRHDVTFPLYVEVDRIFNLACPASPVHYQFDPVQTTKTSVHGAINMLGLAKRVRGAHPPGVDLRGVRRPGGPSRRPRATGEGSTASARAAATTRASAARRPSSSTTSGSTGSTSRSIRIFNTYGPRMHPNDGRVVSNFIVQALRGEDVTIYGDGSQTRSFCYVDDLIEGMLRMMESERGFSGPVNIGNPGEFTMLELAEKVLRLTASKSRLVHKPLPADDPRQRRPDISLARAKLDWEPKVALEDGLVQTIAYFRKLLGT